jgi:hypothetical protein
MNGAKDITKPAVWDTNGLKAIGLIRAVDGFGFAAAGEVINQNKMAGNKLFPAN